MSAALTTRRTTRPIPNGGTSPSFSRTRSVEKKEPLENEFEIDPVDDDQEETARNSRMTRTMQRVARQVSLDPNDGMEL